METLLINEQFVAQFRYWQEGQMRTGMRFRSDLFEYITVFDCRQRMQVFELAERLAEAGKEVVVSASPTQYRVWVNLRMPHHNSSFGQLTPVPTQVTLTPSSQELRLLKTFMSA